MTTYKRRKGEIWAGQGAKKAPELPEPPTKQLHVRLTDAELAELGRLALEHDTSKTRMARRVMRLGFAALSDQPGAGVGP